MGVDSTPLPKSLTKARTASSTTGPATRRLRRNPRPSGDDHPALLDERHRSDHIEQFRKFRPDFKGNPDYAPYAAGVSWYDANGLLPVVEPVMKRNRTACPRKRNGTRRARRNPPAPNFLPATSRRRPSPPTGVGLKNMHTGVAEWVLTGTACTPRAADGSGRSGIRHRPNRPRRRAGLQAIQDRWR